MNLLYFNFFIIKMTLFYQSKQEHLINNNTLKSVKIYNISYHLYFVSSSWYVVTNIYFVECLDGASGTILLRVGNRKCLYQVTDTISGITNNRIALFSRKSVIIVR